ncbi:MAG TPA: glycosyltransferase family 87 protein [Candidatus Limnocylindrales bacterium]|nr:glycosyltransferase family 87 protein [Candidatus Limnocylindrales bacterium]
MSEPEALARRAGRRRAARPADLFDRPTRRRAGVLRRALRREVSRLNDRRRILAMTLLILTFGIVTAGMIGRGDAAGADARAYWAGVRIWLNGGDPYHPTGPFLPYVYAPWMLPLFSPWALLPWDVAWFVWRGATILLLLWSIEWAYRRRPLETAIVVIVLAFPMGANLDTGNITLLLAIGLFGAQFLRPRMAGFLWGLATWMKWAPAPLWLVLRPRARLWGLAWLAASALLSLATLPLTIVQFEALFGFDRPAVRLDYLVLLWALVPWLWRRAEPFGWLRPASWRRSTTETVARARRLTDVRREDPERGGVTARRDVYARVRAFLGIV